MNEPLVVQETTLGLSDCTSTSINELAEATISENVDQLTKDIYLADEHIKELFEEDNKIIDFTFTQAISSTMEPFTFRILGETFGEIPYENMLRVQVESIYVTNPDSKLLQEIYIDAWPRNASEHNRYGLEFDDFNFDGYLDMTIRRYPGDGSNNRTNYYWLWDNKTHQFVYDWKLSEAVTKENLIDFTVTQSVHDDIPQFTFRLLGRWVEGWSNDIQGMADNIDANIHVLQVIDSDGRIIQEFDRLNTIPPRYEPSFGLHFADYNFDGFLDIALYMFKGGTLRNEPHLYWLWDNSLKQFVENEELREISCCSSVSINIEESQLECFSRFSATDGALQHFKYIDDKYILVYSIEWGYEPASDKENEYVRYEIINELIDGKMVVSKNYYDD
jgi:hypothetical protein